jgi:Fe-S cluster assembly protein SufD
MMDEKQLKDVIPAEAGIHQLRVPAGRQEFLIERFDSKTPEAQRPPSKRQVFLGENARFTHYKWVDEGPQAAHQSFLEVEVGKGAVFESHVFLFGGGSIRNTLHVRMAGEGADCKLYGLYVGANEQVIENHTLIDHIGPQGTSRELYKGILEGRSQGVFDGLIVVQKSGQKTDAAQTNKNLLLSPEARANSNPELKIFANDVKCRHGSTIGHLDADSLFYLRSRGIAEAEARRLLIYAFASEMVELVQEPELRKNLQNQIFQKFAEKSPHPHPLPLGEGAVRPGEATSHV